MNHKKSGLALALAGVALLAACGGGEPPAERATRETAPPPAATAPSAPGGSIAGVATYVNGDPDAAIKMDADPACQGLHTEPVFTEKVVADDAGNLANVFVYVKDGAPAGDGAAAEPAILDQKGCQYIPHVSGVMVGQKLLIRNSDPILHNVHALPKKNPEFNQGQPIQGMEFEKTFANPEVMVRFKCDVHPWMSSYLAVLEHPYFSVSGADGSFSIDDLPAGTYVLEAWHEELGTRSQSVTVTAGETVDVAFDFGTPAA